jgi:GNAT superfamily N-acetyltransferase
VSTIPGDPAVLASATAQLRIAERLPSHRGGARLLRAFHSEQVDRYGFADPIELSSREYVPPGGVFVVVYQGAVAAGCCGYRWFDRATRTVEIKRIYVVPASRVHGTGRALLACLENHAVQAGRPAGHLGDRCSQHSGPEPVHQRRIPASGPLRRGPRPSDQPSLRPVSHQPLLQTLKARSLVILDGAASR